MNILEYAKLKKILGGSGGGATAYHLTSADELPEDALDGSLAVVKEEGEEIWAFHDELDNLGESHEAWAGNDSNSTFNIEYTNSALGMAFGDANRVNTGFSISKMATMFELRGGTPTNGMTVNMYTYNPTGYAGKPHGWSDEGYKTIKVLYADDEARRWLEAHATSIGKDMVTTLYSRENGEWVNKGEI